MYSFIHHRFTVANECYLMPIKHTIENFYASSCDKITLDDTPCLLSSSLVGKRITLNLRNLQSDVLHC